jgi:hypothetical protein
VTAEVPPVAGRADLTVTVAPGAARGAPACFVPVTAEIEVNGACQTGGAVRLGQPGFPGSAVLWRHFPVPCPRDFHWA